MTLSTNATLHDAIIVINRLERRITTLENEKRSGRNVTGKRAVPNNSNDLLEGDVTGDFLYNGTHYYELERYDNTGALKWVRYTISVSF
jgi:hypothetical protein